MPPPLATEEDLVSALRAHQSADFPKLYAAYAPALYGVLLRLVTDPIRAEDLFTPGCFYQDLAQQPAL